MTSKEVEPLQHEILLALFDDDDEETALTTTAHEAAIVAALRRRRPRARGGSRPGKQPNLQRDHRGGHERIMKDYFIERPVFTDVHFRRRFRMSRSVFARILERVQVQDVYFVQKPDAVDRQGLSAIQKCMAALRQMAYGTPADACDEYVRTAETTALVCLKRFCAAVVNVFGDEYLRAPTSADLARLMGVNEARGFTGMLGSLDCTHWRWKNCPKAWAGQYAGKEKEPTIVLEAVADYDGWFWHLFFGMPGFCNDINVLDRSPLFSDLVEGRAPPVVYQINRRQYSMGYYLADGIYPAWATLVQSLSNPQTHKKKHFAKTQESARKDVERAFGMLKGQYTILKGPCRLWNHHDMTYIMKACVILRHLAIEDERDPDGVSFDQSELVDTIEITDEQPGDAQEFSRFLRRYKAISHNDTHYQLRNDLIEHLWTRKGEEDMEQIDS